jgi:hypothetical protein
MLYEIENVRQIAGENFRRWFSDEIFDLIVWYSVRDQIIGFQLCYRSGIAEKALTWFHDKGYTHHSIDDGENHPSCFKMTPILVQDGVFESGYILNLFKEAGDKIDTEIVNFVCNAIKNYPS